MPPEPIFARCTKISAAIEKLWFSKQLYVLPSDKRLYVCFPFWKFGTSFWTNISCLISQKYDDQLNPIPPTRMRRNLSCSHKTRYWKNGNFVSWWFITLYLVNRLVVRLRLITNKPTLLRSSHTSWHWSSTKLWQLKCGYSLSIANDWRSETKHPVKVRFQCWLNDEPLSNSVEQVARRIQAVLWRC